MSEQKAPCGVEAMVWRECLKGFDYGPDRKKGACDTQRFKYYDCIKRWNDVEGHPYDPKKFQVPDACSPQALELHDCMKISMFDISRCQPQALRLKTCSARHDPLVMAALVENEEVQEMLKQEKEKAKALSTLDRLWSIIVGKA
jgi:hypothetical protein